MRLIDADRLIVHLSEWELQESPGWGANGYGDARVAETIKEAIKAVEEAHTIEAEPVRHGRWILWGSPFADDGVADSMKCSVCETFFVQKDTIHFFDYCPSCGAKMDL